MESCSLLFILVLVIGSLAQESNSDPFENIFTEPNDKRALNEQLRKSSLLWGKRSDQEFDVNSIRKSSLLWGKRSGEDFEMKRTIPSSIRKSSRLWGKRSGTEGFEMKQAIPGSIRKASLLWGKRSDNESEMELDWTPEDEHRFVKRADFMERVAKGALRPKLALSSRHWG